MSFNLTFDNKLPSLSIKQCTHQKSNKIQDRHVTYRKGHRIEKFQRKKQLILQFTYKTTVTTKKLKLKKLTNYRLHKMVLKIYLHRMDKNNHTGMHYKC